MNTINSILGNKKIDTTFLANAIGTPAKNTDTLETLGIIIIQGKASIANALMEKGVSVPPDPSFETLKDTINEFLDSYKKYHPIIKIFTNTTTYTPIESMKVKIICLGAGGAGGYSMSGGINLGGGGGGAGGAGLKNMTLQSGTTYNITIDSTHSSFNNIITSTCGKNGQNGGDNGSYGGKGGNVGTCTGYDELLVFESGTGGQSSLSSNNAYGGTGGICWKDNTLGSNYGNGGNGGSVRVSNYNSVEYPPTSGEQGAVILILDLDREVL